MQGAGRFGQPRLLPARAARHGRRVVAQPEEAAALSRPADEGRRSRSPEILAKWAANAPLAFVDQYIGSLQQYRGIAMDVGDQDGLRDGHRQAARRARSATASRNTFEIYPGTHTSARRRPLPESRAAVLQQDALRHGRVPVRRGAGDLDRTARQSALPDTLIGTTHEDKT